MFEMLSTGAWSTHLSGVLGLPCLVYRRREDLTGTISQNTIGCRRQKGSLPRISISMEDPSYTQWEDHNCIQQEAHSGFLHLEKALLILQGAEIGNCPV